MKPSEVRISFGYPQRVLKAFRTAWPRLRTLPPCENILGIKDDHCVVKAAALIAGRID